jgi:hypothetical protein
MFSKRRTVGGRRLAVALALLAGCPGCSVLVQNRYSVFGFDALETGSPERARAVSLALLGGVTVASAVLGAATFWLVQRRLRGQPEKRRPTAGACPPPARDPRPEPTEAAVF